MSGVALPDDPVAPAAEPPPSGWSWLAPHRPESAEEHKVARLFRALMLAHLGLSVLGLGAGGSLASINESSFS